MADVRVVTWGEVQLVCLAIAEHWERRQEGDGRPGRPMRLSGVYGIPRGGLVPASIVATELGLPLVARPGPRDLVIDDLVDSGETVKRLDPKRFSALYCKAWSPHPWRNGAIDVGEAWVQFPWEADDERPAFDGALRLLQAAGADTSSGEALLAAGALLDAVRSLVRLPDGRGPSPLAQPDQRFAAR